MIKTTVYLPEELELQLDDSAGVAGISKAEAIRQAIALWVAQARAQVRPARRLPVFNGPQPRTAEEMDAVIAEHIAQSAERR
jgi:Arc/MetJ-type ribon-helix-helix transcriptional regulator